MASQGFAVEYLDDILNEESEPEDGLLDDSLDDSLVLEGEIIPPGVDILDDTTMSRQEAQELTNEIRSTSTALSALLYRANQGRAYLALGYTSWADYVKTEFDITAQRGYQLINLEKVTREIESVVPEGTEIKLTESQARDIKRSLDKITARVEAETAHSTPQEAEDIVQDIIEEARERKKEEDDLRKEVQKIEEAKKKKEEEEAQQAEYDALEAQADALLEEHGGLGGGDTDFSDDDYMPEAALTASDSASIYSFYTMIDSRSALPDAQRMAQLVPDNDHKEVLKKVEGLQAWIEEFLREMRSF